MAEPNKDILYIDIDDEITAIIDKVRASTGKVVALVLPKRATTLQSIVNMKLLKRAADEGKKNLVLVTTESGLLPLAGAVGLHVASTPTSRPEIPAAPAAPRQAEEQVDETDALLADDEPTNPDLAAASSTSVGELAASTMPVPAPRPTAGSGIETVELDNEDAPAATAATGAAAALPKIPKFKKDRKLRVPDFDRFRTMLLLGGLLIILLVVGAILALVVLPKATINIKTDASNVNTNVDFTLNTGVSALNTASKVVPAKQVLEQKTYTAQAPTTGQQNNGQKAAGSVSMTSTICGSFAYPADVPSGTGVTSGGHTYITQSDVSFSVTTIKNGCGYFQGNSTNIIAQSAGASSNTSSKATFAVPGRSDVSASGSASGGTDNIQQVVAQADIDNAKAKISSSNSVQSDLTSQLSGQGLYAINATYSAGTPAVTTSNNVGDVANNVTVTETITFTMLGAQESDLKTLLDNNIKNQIDTSKQSILTEGLNQSAIKLVNATSDGAAMNMQTTGEVGPEINTANVAQQAAGKKSGDIRASLKTNPDITDVTVKLSPFWVTTAPKNLHKITVNVAKPTTTK